CSNAVTQGTDFSGLAISGSGSFTQAGSGTTTLTANNTYTGATNINNGTVIVSGSLSATTSVTVSNATLKVNGAINALAALTVGGGGTLKGSGSVGSVTASSGGTVAPGNSTGIITFNGDFNLQAGAHLAIEIGGTVAGFNHDGTDGYDQVQLAGSGRTLTIDGDLQGTLLSGYVANSGNASFNVNTQQLNLDGDKFFLVIGAGSAVQGAGFSNQQGADSNLTGFNTITFGGQEFAVSYTANAGTNSFTGGNDVAIMAIPEPNTYAMVIGGVGMLMFYRKLRRRNA